MDRQYESVGRGGRYSFSRCPRSSDGQSKSLLMIGPQVRVLPRALLFCLGVSGTDEPSEGISRACLVVAGGVEGEVSELFAVVGDDSDVEVADEDEYSSTAMFSAGSDVV